MHAKRLVLCGLVLPLLGTMAWGNGGYYLYSPAPASKDQASAKAKEEVAVREITVAKGDTLFGISRRFSGKGTYYPQILLFNDIKNPNLIHIGQSLRVPLPDGNRPYRQGKSRQQLKTSLPRPDTKAAPAAEPMAVVPLLNPTVPAAALAESPLLPPTAETEQALFAQGVRAYKSGSCSAAAAHFDQFLARYPDSLMAADAALYRADCYLQLAAE